MILYDYLDYHDYEQKLDALFKRDKSLINHLQWGGRGDEGHSGIQRVCGAVRRRVAGGGEGCRRDARNHSPASTTPRSACPRT